MDMWNLWKKGFNSWETATAELCEQILRSPLVLQPSGAALSAAMRAKAAHDQALARWWAAVGLPTRRDQERTLHALNQLQSRVIDLEERLARSQQG
jgi:hypothetical protein